MRGSSFLLCLFPLLGAMGCNLLAGIDEPIVDETSSTTGGSGGAPAGGAGGGGGGGAGACVDGNTESCYTGSLDTLGAGNCTPGTKVCAGGEWGSCVGEILPAAETCDGQDNDCNGQLDEGCPCIDGDPCYPFGGQPGQGGCKAGTKVCHDGELVECQGAVGPTDELCNGLDDDCDAVTDDVAGLGNACSTGELGICGIGQIACDIAEGVVGCEPIALPTAEQCDGLDNDCNGPVDDIPADTCTVMVASPNGPVACKGVSSCVDNQSACAPKTLFFDDFSAANGGWDLADEWKIGPTQASPPPGEGNPDPAMDHTPTVDNGIAGAFIGSNLTDVTGAKAYLTSKPIDTTGWSTLYLSYWRWLNSGDNLDYPHSVEVTNNGGVSWALVWVNGSDAVFDADWTRTIHDMSSFSGGVIRIRFGFQKLTAGAPSVSGWNIDDLAVSSCPPSP
jgi:hypothetical protein